MLGTNTSTWAEISAAAHQIQVKTLFEAADTRLTNLEGSSPITDMPKCLHLLDGGRVCWVHSVRGEEVAAPDPAVGAGLVGWRFGK